MGASQLAGIVNKGDAFSLQPTTNNSATKSRTGFAVSLRGTF